MSNFITLPDGHVVNADFILDTSVSEVPSGLGGYEVWVYYSANPGNKNARAITKGKKMLKGDAEFLKSEIDHMLLGTNTNTNPECLHEWATVTDRTPSLERTRGQCQKCGVYMHE